MAQHRDIIQNEYARANLAKSKLENLCRELQKHSKQVAVGEPALVGGFRVEAGGVKFQPPPPPQDESRQRAKEEEDRRKEVSGKFQSTINEITLKMQEHHQRNQALRQENLE